MKVIIPDIKSVIFSQSAPTETLWAKKSSYIFGISLYVHSETAKNFFVSVHLWIPEARFLSKELIESHTFRFFHLLLRTASCFVFCFIYTFRCTYCVRQSPLNFCANGFAVGRVNKFVSFLLITSYFFCCQSIVKH